MRPVVGLKRARTLGNRPSEDAWTMVPEPVIISCTGLGAAELFGDPELQPVKGQLTVPLPQPEIDYAVLAGHLYMFARSDGIQLRGTHERGVATLEPNLEAKRELVAGHARFFAGMAGARRGIVG